MSKLKYNTWAQYITTYWDWQLHLDFDYNCDITYEKNNHNSATEYPHHVTAYLSNLIYCFASAISSPQRELSALTRQNHNLREVEGH